MTAAIRTSPAISAPTAPGCRSGSATSTPRTTINPTYGTARVLAAYRDLDLMNDEPARRGVAWLLANQNADGGWGGGRGSPSSMEETSLAVEILLDAEPACFFALGSSSQDQGSASNGTARKSKRPCSRPPSSGLKYLIDAVEHGDLHHPTPIGFYFAKLWYFEKLYPMIFAVAALGRARVKLGLAQRPE